MELSGVVILVMFHFYDFFKIIPRFLFCLLALSTSSETCANLGALKYGQREPADGNQPCTHASKRNTRCCFSFSQTIACLPGNFFFASYLTITAHKLTSPKSRYNCAAELFCCLFVAINFPIHFLARNAAHCTKITCCYALKPIKYSRKSTWRNKMRSETCSRGIKYNGARYKSSSTRLN